MPEAVTFDQVATILSAELGRPIHYEAASLLCLITNQAPGITAHGQPMG